MTAILASTNGFKDMADGTLRLTIDVEPGDAQAALALFGKRGTPVALARITDDAAMAHDRARQQETPAVVAGQDGAVPALGDPEASRPAAVPSEPVERRVLSLASKVALRCQEQSFHQFLQERDWDRWDHAEVNPLVARPDEVRASQWVRWECGVESRSDIRPGTLAAETWHSLEADYLHWQRGQSGRAA